MPAPCMQARQAQCGAHHCKYTAVNLTWNYVNIIPIHADRPAGALGTAVCSPPATWLLRLVSRPLQAPQLPWEPTQRGRATDRGLDFGLPASCWLPLSVHTRVGAMAGVVEEGSRIVLDVNGDKHLFITVKGKKCVGEDWGACC